MKLVIGGAFQGKLDFAKKMTGKETGWADGAAVSKEELSACSGVYDFQELVRRWLLLEEETGTAPEAELEELLQKADLVSLHCPLTEGTHHMINKDTIAMMIPCLCSFLFTVPSSPSAEPLINKKRTRTLSRKESGSSTNCMVDGTGLEPVTSCTSSRCSTS